MQITRSAVALIVVATAVSCGRDGARAGPTASSAPSLIGTITSLGTRGGVAGASVQFTDGSNAGKSAVSDMTGHYRIDGLTPGGAGVKVTASLFEDQTQTVTVAGSTTLDLDLRRKACEGAGVSCTLQPSPCNETMPIFQPPFVGDFVTSNFMDHNVPLQFQANNGAFVSYCGGANGRGGIDGHSGYDWLLPHGSPVLAVAAGTVRFAGTDPPFFCPTLGRDVTDQMVVLIDHTSPNGEALTSVYVHLSQITVRAGQTVGGGQEIGLSGNTGCSTQAHLHFEVRRAGTSGTAVTDPYGWQGRQQASSGRLIPGAHRPRRALDWLAGPSREGAWWPRSGLRRRLRRPVARPYSRRRG
jgi:murein DD-endopeptidase MepM/ murein hydrolase activator NlpD